MSEQTESNTAWIMSDMPNSYFPVTEIVSMYVASNDYGEWVLVSVLAHPIIEEGESYAEVTLNSYSTSAEAHGYARALIALMGGILIHQYQDLP